jgi:hypothetical protein
LQVRNESDATVERVQVANSHGVTVHDIFTHKTNEDDQSNELTKDYTDRRGDKESETRRKCSYGSVGLQI